MQPAGYAEPGLVAGNSTALVLVLLSQLSESVRSRHSVLSGLFTCKLQSDSLTGAATRHFFHFLSSVLLYSTLAIPPIHKTSSLCPDSAPLLPMLDMVARFL